MLITKDKVVAITYELKDPAGNLIDKSDDEPLYYLHGAGNIIPGLEEALDGKTSGDNLHVEVTPAEGYGEYDPDLKQAVDRKLLQGVDELAVGMQFQVQNEDNTYMVVTVVDLKDDSVVLDGNHPLAGTTLKFDVTVEQVRDATEEEIAHGHVHGPGGHHN